MTYEVDRDFRDFRRWNETYPLPQGDPTSGVHTIGKAQIRDRFNHFYSRADHVEEMLDDIEGIIGDAVSASNVPIFSTVTSAAAASINALLPVIQVTGRTTAGTGWGLFKRVSSSVKGPGRFQDAAGQWWLPYAGTLSIMNGTDEIIVGVGTTGDYANLPDAFAGMLKFADAGGNIVLRLVSPITRTDLLRNADYSAFTITSSIGTVPLASGFEGFTDSTSNLGVPANNKANNLIGGFGCRMPTLGCVIDMAHQGANGYYPVWNVSRAIVLPNCGVINAGYVGLEARNSIVTAHQAKFSGALLHGIRAAHEASIAAQSANCDDCVQFPDLYDPEDYDDFVGSVKTAAAVDCSRGSSIHFRSGLARRSGGSGFNARRASKIVIELADFSEARHYGLYLHGNSVVSGYGLKAKDCGWSGGAQTGGYGAWIRSGMVGISGAVITGSGNTTGADIRIGDSDPSSAAAIIDATRTLTTRIYDAETGKIKSGSDYADAITNIAGADTFNFPSKYGIAWNAAATSPWDIGIYSGTGATAGKTITGDRVLRSSVTSTEPRTHQTFANTNGIVLALRTTGSGGGLENTSDEAIKDRVAPIFEAWAERGVDGRELIDWLLDQFVGFDWLRQTDLKPTGKFDVGVVAQQLATRLPGLVTPRKGEPGSKDWEPASVNYLGLLPYLGAAANLHREEIRDLRAQNAALEARLAALESRIS